MPSALIMAGGTGGHVFPALAVAEALRAQGWDTQWLGTQRGIEARLVPQAGISLHTMQVQGLRGKGMLSLLKAPFNLMRALWQARRILRQCQPSLVLGFGGFASGPGGLMARLQGLPLVIHEQNARAGTTNRLLAPIATRVLEAFDSGLKNAEQVGNPVRESIRAIAVPQTRLEGRTGPIQVLVLGGSLGAQFFNQTLPSAFAKLDKPVQVVHQTGEKWAEACQQQYAQAGFDAVRVQAFIEDMAAAYEQADLVICRAGALTVSEVACAGAAALFVPYPHAIDDHQTANARWLVERGAARMYAQSALDENVLIKELNGLCDRAVLSRMAIKARECARPEATASVVTVCQEVIND
ncbi:undecaprenyldiphospho-muramoylpentapeptide beta-N-acetylglucosaminyltransferase [Simiduia agarivorans]|uniref:UDP-N-acetylglucosamine--N-acetylmuramyl-(pentapeptide) pyrophosphoryl-undecaprenol N-acetylglucosamine transferase n=1 Tax=Simiduia agarivorans (strain DSM 21679 / JCM 13881 / BCRC 17597 / SA1) TaxID=1117647 RepID=K4KR18_SIMAS|nr:undecaprenyldiphospho-muramoylpentapeptide beta-N-acetylglucosaminyltransferase [Simiduia agarivorans]AFV00691.1 undecaprenyldiphospho-muramoylpentapeptide beta-N- acetylglucosaminyltransferase [Simiduia agarivorans SA1 = DSM 21679]